MVFNYDIHKPPGTVTGKNKKKKVCGLKAVIGMQIPCQTMEVSPVSDKWKR